MIFYGIQKLSLVDYDGEISSTLFTSGCNFRCPFCHNFELVISPQESLKISEEEALEFLKSRVGKITAVCITGGEPTLQKDLKEFIIKVKNLGLKVKLDTNGTNPNLVKDLIETKLIDFIAVDCKNSFNKYFDTVDANLFGLDKVKETINYLINSDFNYELRTTIMNKFHDKNSIDEMGKDIKGAKRLVLQRFVMSEHVPDRSLNSINEKDALEFKHILEKYVKNVSLRGY